MHRLAMPFLLAASTAAAQSGDWPAYGHDRSGTRYSPLSSIDRSNVARLTVAWTYHTGEMAPEYATRRGKQFEATPLVVDGTMYLSTPLGRVIALDPVTGTTKWTFNPHLNRYSDYGDFANRGVSTWIDPSGRRRIYIAVIDGRLICLDAHTGKLCEGFGDNGTVDLLVGIRNPPDWAEEFEETSPPAIVHGLIVVGSGIADNNRINATSGMVRAYDARTGALRWTWDPVPQDSADPAWRTWVGPHAHETGAANVWSVIAVDSARDLVILPTTSPSVDYYGGERLGDNRYGNSVVALRASTGKVVWAFQTVHHDLWDYDNAAPPALVTTPRGDAVLEGTKTGMLYVLDRETGKPLFPVEERPVPKSTVPGEQASPTQPFSSIVLSPHHLNIDSLTPECRAIMANLRNEGIFTPPSLEGTLVIPSNIGGVSWGGVAYDPARAIAVAGVNTVAAEVQLIPADKLDRAAADSFESRYGYQYTRMHGTPYVMRRRIIAPNHVPCTPQPWGSLVAVSLKTGERVWDVPLGMGGKGSLNLGGPIVTAGGLVFVGAALDRKLRAFDIETGRELWSGDLPAGARATPMTYRASDGRQYVVVAAGGSDVWGDGDALVAFALPH
jgi:quinoprotein glucose dehydrogenase